MLVYFKFTDLWKYQVVYEAESKKSVYYRFIRSVNVVNRRTSPMKTRPNKIKLGDKRELKKAIPKTTNIRFVIH